MQKQMENFMEFLLEDDEGFEHRFLKNLSEKEREVFEEEISKLAEEEFFI